MDATLDDGWDVALYFVVVLDDSLVIALLDLRRVELLTVSDLVVGVTASAPTPALTPFCLTKDCASSLVLKLLNLAPLYPLTYNDDDNNNNNNNEAVSATIREQFVPFR